MVSSFQKMFKIYFINIFEPKPSWLNSIRSYQPIDINITHWFGTVSF
jgi:hypothetical protein